MSSLLKQGMLHFAKGIDPVADAFAGTKYSDVYSMAESKEILFVIYAGVGATGTSVVTVEACDDFTPTNTSAITFRYQEITSGDTHGALTNATTSGFTTTAGSSRIVLVYANAEDLASSGYKNIRLKMVEDTNSPVVGAVLAILDTAKYEKEISNTVIA